jgi:hypothetical protein
MSDIDYALMLRVLYPGGGWWISGNTYDGIGVDEGIVLLPQEEFDSLWPQVKFDVDYSEVERDRRAAYITDADPLFFKWQRGTGTEQAWLDAVQAVKDAHPYPEATFGSISEQGDD